MAVGVLAAAPAAQAQCAFRPGVASRLKVPMVRALEQCAGTRINTETGAGIGGCSPSRLPPSGYRCSARPSSCSPDLLPYSDSLGDGVACPVRYCGGAPSVPYSYQLCYHNADCVVSPPESTGICEDHPENACIPDSPVTSYSFEAGGACELSAASKVEADCSVVASSSGVLLGLPAQACHVTKLKVRCRGILASDSVRISGAAHSGWTLSTWTRATLDDAVAGYSTQVDFPVTFAFDLPRGGAIFLNSSTAEALLPLLGTVGAALPPCINLQPVEARVLDPGGAPFAVVGLATRP